MGRCAYGDFPAMDGLVLKTASGVGEAIGRLQLPQLAGVVLGGGYARGEGGVFTDGTPRLSNDLDFYVVTREGASAGDIAEIAAALAPIAKEWTPLAGVQIDFCVPKTPWRLRHDSRRIMIQELIRGYIDVAGEKGEKLFATIPRYEACDIPAGEAARLLMNRGMGLLFAMESQDQAFRARNINKCVLGAGDARLVVRREYAWSAAERAKRLGETLHIKATEWKFRPAAEAPCTWEEARETWLDACGEVFAAAPELKRRSLYEAVRWIRRRGTVRPIATFGRDATVRVLENIHERIAARRTADDALVEDWRIFN